MSSRFKSASVSKPRANGEAEKPTMFLLSREDLFIFIIGLRSGRIGSIVARVHIAQLIGLTMDKKTRLWGP